MKFTDLYEVKTPAVVMVALAFDADKKAELIAQMNEIFTADGLLIEGAKVVNVEKIEGNILGDKGRTDVLIHLDKFAVNPVVRIMKWRDVKWLEDFIENCRADYGVGHFENSVLAHFAEES